MEANDYQDKVIELSKNYPIWGTSNALPVYSLGLAGETGEVMELLKRHFRGDEVDADFKYQLTKELGDVAAYLVLVANHFNIKFDHILEMNLLKTSMRLEKGTILGKGNDR
jgi:NTP pyrophosphatase (non-canonical NTP hydrolase)